MKTLLLVALFASLAFVPTVAASHVTCAARNPFPPSPVGGAVGQAYGVATTAAWGAELLVLGLTCTGANLALHTIDAACQILIGRPCLA